jgi:hypothetical protein
MEYGSLHLVHLPTEMEHQPRSRLGFAWCTVVEGESFVSGSP